MNGIDELERMLESRSTDYGRMRQILAFYKLGIDKEIADAKRLAGIQREPLKFRFEYCVQFRHKRTNEPWSEINWSIGPLKRAREALKYMLDDNTYRQYEYRVAVHRLTDWEAR